MVEVNHRLRHSAKHYQHDLWHSKDLRDVIPSVAVDRLSSCYTTNEVLVIIGLTCILNLVFIALIMSVAHFCSISSLTTISRPSESTFDYDKTPDSDLIELGSHKSRITGSKQQIIEHYVKRVTQPLEVRASQSSTQSRGPRLHLDKPTSSLSMECLLFV